MVFGAKNLFVQLKRPLEEGLNAHYSAREIDTMLLWLLEHITQLTKVDVIRNKEITLSDRQYQSLVHAIQRLQQEEPVQYIMGEAEFYGRKFAVNPSVLIPRRETEELIYLIIREHAQAPGLRVLDIGTGSGCIAITLAKELQQAHVWALDHSAGALAVAKQNARALDAPVRYLHQDILREVPSATFDIIVSNPPYVLKSEAGSMRRNVLHYEPPEALFVEDANPLLFYKRISELCEEILAPAGCLYFEINERYASEVVLLVKCQRFEKVTIEKDMQGKDRFIKAYKTA